MTALRLVIAGLLDLVKATGRRAYYVPVVAKPGGFAVLTTPDSLPGYRKINPDWEAFDNRVSARESLTLARYRPGPKLRQARTPVLACIAEHDVVTPAALALKAAGRAPTAKIIRYAGGHFDLYDGPHFERAAADQVAFLQQHLGARPAAVATGAPAR